MSQNRSPTSVLNCPIEFVFQCKKSWDDMELTDRDNVRHCGLCRKNVYLVSTDAEIGWAIRTNKCIAWKLPSDLQEEVDTCQFSVGEPDKHLGKITREVIWDATVTPLDEIQE